MWRRRKLWRRPRKLNKAPSFRNHLVQKSSARDQHGSTSTASTTSYHHRHRLDVRLITEVIGSRRGRMRSRSGCVPPPSEPKPNSIRHRDVSVMQPAVERRLLHGAALRDCLYYSRRPHALNYQPDTATGDGAGYCDMPSSRMTVALAGREWTALEMRCQMAITRGHSLPSESDGSESKSY